MLDPSLTQNADAALTGDQRDWLRVLREFCEREFDDGVVRAQLADAESTDEASLGALARLGELGFTGLPVEERFGGAGGGYRDATLFLEEAVRGRAPVAPYSVTLIVAGLLTSFGTQEQKLDLLGRVCDGGVLAIAMSEPQAGSDVAALATTAVAVDGGWRLSGQKVWCSYAHLSSHVLVVCRRPGSTRHEGMSMLLVPVGADGMKLRLIETMAGSDTSEVFLDDCFVPSSALVGVEGAGWMQLMAGLNVERVILAAVALGLAQRAFDDALAYAKSREQFGRPIGSFQVTQHKLADMATALVQARALTRWVAGLIDEQPERLLPQEASMAKLAASETARMCALEGMQILGGYGYATEYLMERYARSALAFTVFGGTSEIQRNIIARTLGL